jgi:Ca2+-binding EF-hand superfamily protein
LYNWKTDIEISRERFESLGIGLPTKLIHSIAMLFDNWYYGSVNMLQVLGVALLLCAEEPGLRVEKLFELFDMEERGILSKEQVEQMFTTVLAGFCRMVSSQNLPQARIR